MNEDQIPNLPSACCANCGFLYAVNPSPATKEDAIVDPDLIRLPSYGSIHLDRQKYTDDPGRAVNIITSRPYAIPRIETVYRERHAGHPTSLHGETVYAPPDIYTLAWNDIFSVCCYMKIWEPVVVRRKKGSEGIGKNLEVKIEDLLQKIRQDRSTCAGFFPYHPGLTPSSHVELKIADKMDQRAQQHTEALATWSLDLESKWRERENRLAIYLGIIGALIAIIVVLLQALISFFLPR
jgi:hypothetical protein